jgi:YfiH family protein
MAQLLFTARQGGTSVGSFESFNLGDHVGDTAEAVAENRKILRKLLSQKQPIFMNQVHGNDVAEVDGSTVSPITADALVTRETGLPLAVLSADCLPILIKGRDVAAVIHAGRKGILNGVISKTISKIRSLSNAELVATIGPAICSECYEVDVQMYLDAIAIEPNLATTLETHCLDLKKAATVQLQRGSAIVNVLEICTAHDPNFFSYRRDGISGRNAGVIVL